MRDFGFLVKFLVKLFSKSLRGAGYTPAKLVPRKRQATRPVSEAYERAEPCGFMFLTRQPLLLCQNILVPPTNA